MKRIGFAIALGWIVLASGQAKASQLLGASVSGNLEILAAPAANFFERTYGYSLSSSTAYQTNSTTVTIADPAVEFGFQESNNVASLDFTDTQLIFNEVTTAPNIPVHAFRITFTSSAFNGLALTKLQDNFYSGGLTATLTNDTLVITNPGSEGIAQGEYGAVFQFAPIPTPEPGTIVMAVSALPIGLGVWMQRRRRAGKNVSA